MTPRVAIVGAAETARIGTVADRSALAMHVEAAHNCLTDAGATLDEVDGIATAGLSAVEVADCLGLRPSWIDTTNVGGSSFLAHVRHAAAALRCGYATTVLITHGESGRSGIGQAPEPVPADSVRGQFEVPYGALFASTRFPVPLLRYMHDYGLTEEQLATVAVVQREWAARNPRAKFRDPITVADVLASRIIAYPLHLLECCLVTDGGAAILLTTADRAADRPQPPVFIAGTGEATEALSVAQMADATTSAAFRRSGQAAFAEAGLGPADIDHLMVYDAFAHLPIYGLEDLGFVARGEAGAFVADGNTRPGGSLPMNTNGGGLSYTHTGMYGMFAIQESVRQLRGQAAAQVPDVEVSFVLGAGGTFSAAAALVLTT